jgi:hypothetical protein
MLKRLNGILCIFTFAGLFALGCDSNTAAPATGTGGTIGGGTGGGTGTGGAGTGGVGGTAPGGTGGTSAGGAGGLSPTQQNDAIINAVTATGVIATDPSIAGTAPMFMTGGVCQ